MLNKAIMLGLIKMQGAGDIVNDMGNNVKTQMDAPVEVIAVIMLIAGIVCCMATKKKLGIGIIICVVVSYIFYLIISTQGLGVIKSTVGM